MAVSESTSAPRGRAPSSPSPSPSSGTGTIGKDLVSKVHRSPVLHCGLVAGRNQESALMMRHMASPVKLAEPAALVVGYGARALDGCARGFGAGAGNTQLEVLVPVLERSGFEGGRT